MQKGIFLCVVAFSLQAHALPQSGLSASKDPASSHDFYAPVDFSLAKNVRVPMTSEAGNNDAFNVAAESGQGTQVRQRVQNLVNTKPQTKPQFSNTGNTGTTRYANSFQFYESIGDASNSQEAARKQPTTEISQQNSNTVTNGNTVVNGDTNTRLREALERNRKPSNKPATNTNPNPATSGSTTSKTGGSTWYEPNPDVGAIAANPGSYKCYGGKVAAYPKLNEWISFNAMFELNKPTILEVNQNSEDIVQHIHDGIIQVSKEEKVDPRLILALCMEESECRARVPCSVSGNCGLLQAGKGSRSFNPSNPKKSIYNMLKDGIGGTSQHAGLAEFVNNPGAYKYTKLGNKSDPFKASRTYNSGTVVSVGDLDVGNNERSPYVNNIANRVTGNWDGRKRGCVQAKCGYGSRGNCGRVS